MQSDMLCMASFMLRVSSQLTAYPGLFTIMTTAAAFVPPKMVKILIA